MWMHSLIVDGGDGCENCKHHYIFAWVDAHIDTPLFRSKARLFFGVGVGLKLQFISCSVPYSLKYSRVTDLCAK